VPITALIIADLTAGTGRFAIWNKNTQPANMSRPRFFERLWSRALGGALGSW
jgi:hypothetical protein